MKYSREVIDLMAAYPGRDFRSIEIIRYVMSMGNYEMRSVRMGVARVLDALIGNGSVFRRPPRTSRGSFALYRWKVTHAVEKSTTDSATFGHPELYLYEAETAEVG